MDVRLGKDLATGRKFSHLFNVLFRTKYLLNSNFLFQIFEEETFHSKYSKKIENCYEKKAIKHLRVSKYVYTTNERTLNKVRCRGCWTKNRF